MLPLPLARQASPTLPVPAAGTVANPDRNGLPPQLALPLAPELVAELPPSSKSKSSKSKSNSKSVEEADSLSDEDLEDGTVLVLALVLVLVLLVGVEVEMGDSV